MPSRSPRSGRPLRVLSLFSGAGGLDAGFDAAGGFDLVAAVELEPQFCATLRKNRDAGLFGSATTRIINADIAQLDAATLMADLDLEPGDIDVVIGGPPCQTWSTAGKRETVRDPRGMLIWDFTRFVEALRPQMFLMENVRGLLSGALRHRPIADRPPRSDRPLEADELPGSAVEAWADDVTKIGDGEYRVDVIEVNAANYGAPQIRERVLFFGTRRNARVRFPAPTHGRDGSGLSPYRTIRDALGDWVDPQPVLMDFSPRKKKYLGMVPEGGNWRTLPDDVQRESMGRAYFAKGGRSGWWRRLSWDLPCPTITTLPNHSSTSLCHPTETRVLTVGEFARLQEFPDGWTFCGSPAEQMRQVGNAVPARLGLVAANVIKAHLEASGTDEDAPAAFRRIYLDSHVRTRRWWHNGQVYVRTNGADEARTAAVQASTDTTSVRTSA